jgi:NTP pyrophosphatase (non-canonical NTP hydrolase)
MEETAVVKVVNSLDLNVYLGLAMKVKAPSEGLQDDYTHSTAGLLTEVGELVDNYKRHWFYKKDIDRVNLREELGDLLWYVALGFYSLESSFPEIDPLPEYEAGEGPTDNFVLGKMVRYASMPLVYSLCFPNEWATDQKNDFEYDLVQLLRFLNMFANRIGTTLGEAAYLNIEKLSKRYPEGFTEYHALNRDTVNELSHIKVEEPKQIKSKQTKKGK